MGSEMRCAPLRVCDGNREASLWCPWPGSLPTCLISRRQSIFTGVFDGNPLHFVHVAHRYLLQIAPNPRSNGARRLLDCEP